MSQSSEAPVAVDARQGIAAPLDLKAGRLSPAQYQQHFADVAPRLTPAQALLEAERCLYCFDAPCTTACPTGIDVPSFIRRIADGNLTGAARGILLANPLGGTCARVCPTELLCEQVCVRNTQSGQPVAIGRLQRHAVDAVMHQPLATLLPRARPSGRRVAVVGAGPAGLACAVVLARLGHDVVLHDAKPKAGGLNEYGLATYKVPDGFAQQELDWLLGMGGITLQLGWRLDGMAGLTALRGEFDAVYLAIGLAGTARLGLNGEDKPGVRDAIDFIAELRQAASPASVPVGRRVVVIGGGMTAIDAAVQSKLLGADEVHLVYRRGPEQMGASPAEQDWARHKGVVMHHWLAPDALLWAPVADGQPHHVHAVRFAGQALVGGQLHPTGEHQTFAADTVLKAIGQQLDSALLAGSHLPMLDGRVVADDDGRTALPGVYAGGDCRLGGRDLTVEAVQDGKRAALAMHAQFSQTA